jgi:antitoxin component YwqK of YwqJK toxin-antitoxin module
MKTSIIYFVLAFLLINCSTDKKKEVKQNNVQSQEYNFSIEGTIEKIDSTYSSGFHKVSTFYDEKTSEKKAHVKFYENGHPYTDIRFKNGVRNGESYSYHKNGNPFSVNTYLNGIWHGPYKTFFENGQPRIVANYLNGKEDGEWIQYYSNGKIDTRGTYKDGVKTGVWTTYSEEGSLLRETDYSAKK